MKRVWGLIIAASALSTAVAHADDTGATLLDGSTTALIMGPTFIPDPANLPGYIPDIDDLYLQDLGFTGTDITPLVTPESPIFGPSIAEGELDLVDTVEADYNAGGDVTWATDPLTITAYSQSTVIASLAEPILYAYGIPSSDLRFVFIGDATADPSTGATGLLDTLGDTTFGEDILDFLGWGSLVDATTPNDLYPTDVYTLTGDFWADYPVSADQGWILGFFEHGAYMGLTESEIQAAMNDTATTDVDGLTTYYTIPEPSDLIETLLQTTYNDFFFG
jgi:PE-PPE domain